MMFTLDRLSDPVLAQARARLGVIAWVFALLFLLGSLSGGIWYAAGGTALNLRYVQYFDLVTALLWFLLAILTMVQSIGHLTMLRLGQVSLVVICFAHVLIGALNTVHHAQALPVLAWNTLFIAVYPLLIPSSPRATAVVASVSAATAPLALALVSWFGGSFPLTDYLAVSIAPGVAVILAVVGSNLIYRNTVDVAVLQEHETLLETVLAGVSESLVLRDLQDDVVFANASARLLLGDALASGPPRLRAAIDAKIEGLVTAEVEGRRESYLITQRSVQLNNRTHSLLLVRSLTSALDEAEVESWKKLIRALSHELNNTLAPMSSMLHSVELMLDRPEHRERLDGALDSMRDRVEHLGDFLSEYAAFARL